MWNKAYRGDFKHELTKVCEFYYGDFDKIESEAELLTLQQLYHSAIGSEAPTVDNMHCLPCQVLNEC